MSRLILAVCLLLSAAPAFAQGDWGRDARERARELRREARQEARERREELRREARERWEEWRREGRDGVHLRILNDYYLSADATAPEPVVVIGGDATIDGHAEDDVVVVGGTLRVGPKAVIDGNVTTVGGEAQIDPAATVRGNVDEAVVHWPDLGIGFGWPSWNWWPVAALSATLLRLVLVLVVSLLVIVVAPNWIRSMGVRASSAFSSGLLGAVVEVLFVPAMMAIVLGLLISIVGIPLLGAIPFVLGAGALAWTGGFAAVAVCLGARLRGGSVATSTSLITDFLLGFVALSAVSVIAYVISLGPGWLSPVGWMMRAAGNVIEYVAWTIGLGAVVSGFWLRSPSMPPPVPASSTLY